MGKGEIACFKQFLLFPQRFLKIYTADTETTIWTTKVNGALRAKTHLLCHLQILSIWTGLVWERVKFGRVYNFFFGKRLKDDNFNEHPLMISVIKRAKDNGKQKMLVTSMFSPQYFQNASFSGCWIWLVV